MSLALSILASGSSGNCAVLRTPAGSMLIDCGIGPRTTAGRLRQLGASLGDVTAICLTHLDRDHFNFNWLGQIVRQNILVFCHETRVAELVGLVSNDGFSRMIRAFNGQSFTPMDGLQFRAIRLDHDELGSHGFTIDGFGGRIGYATDLGRVGEELLRRFRGLDVLAIESNYDPQMQLASDRPLFLKRRIMGGRGHLSNAQALEAVRRILDQAQRRGEALPRHIVLLHRSRQCNCPALLRDLFSADARIETRLVLAEQDRPTSWLRITPSPAFRQMELSF
jgi:phosphoribosyl 1,2-cyclic phosphodiesterase